MTEHPLLPPLDEASEPIVVPPKPPPHALFPWLAALGFLVLAGAIFYVWEYPNTRRETAEQAAALRAIEQRLSDMDGRLNHLEQRPTVDLGKLTARMDGLDAKLADQGQFASRLDTVSARIELLAARDQTSLDANKRQLETLASRVSAQEASAGNSAGSVEVLTKRFDRVMKLQEASLAFSAGRPIGDLPNAPQALARFAHSAPPTEAQLRLQFPQAEQTALAAEQPDIRDAPFVNCVWERAQGLVTIRQGDNVVVGNSSAAALSRAKAALDAGDLAGAVNAVETLKGQPGQAMAGWLTEAKALLDARAALADMAGQA